MDKKKLAKVLGEHRKWLSGKGGERADLRRTNLQGANLQGANLQGANLQGANLQEADLQGANLQGADLREANLRWADLHGANLREANLRGADLREANLRGADLRGANLRGADLDFSCWPLWCGSHHVKVDKRLAVQLAAHLCALDCDDAEFVKLRKILLPFARDFHRISEFPLED